MTKLLNELKTAGMDVHQFSRSEDPRYHLIENKGDEKKENIIELHSIIDLVDNIRTIGRRGLSIQRYKGLGDEPEAALRNDDGSEDSPTPQGRHRRRRRSRRNLLHAYG